MSGPKIVRVISLEEKQRTVKRQQRKMLHALHKLRLFAQNNQQLSSDLSQALEQRQAEYTALNESHYDTIDAFSHTQIHFLNAKLESLESDLIDQVQQRKHQVRQIKMAASGLQQAFQQRDLAVPNTLNELSRLPLAIDSTALAQAEQTLQTQLHLLMEQSVAEASTQPLPAELQALQSRLSTDDPVQSLSGWIQTQQPTTSKQQQRLDKLLSRLEMMRTATNDHPAIDEFVTRAEALEKQPSTTSSSHEALVTDSLILDVSQFIQNRQQYQDRLEHLDQHLQTLLESQEQTPAAEVLIVEIQRVLADSNTKMSILASLQQQAEDYLEQQHTQMVADSRRAAILQGLQAMGYQVNETMSSAWVEDGRLVVRKAADNQYGIELTTNPEMQRLQARVVVNEGAKQRSRDTDTQAETLWCGDFTSLQHIIEAQQGQLIIDKAMPIGSQALKEVSGGNQADEERRRGYQQQGGLRSREL